MKFKELFLSLLLLVLILSVIAFTLPTHTSMPHYVYLDGAFILTDKPIYLSNDTIPGLIVGRYSLNWNTIKGTSVKFLWNKEEKMGRLLDIKNGIVFINSSGFIYKVPLSNVALSVLNPEQELIPEDVVGIGINSLKWKGDTLLYYDKERSLLDIGVKITNNGDKSYQGPFYLIAENIPGRERFIPVYRAMALEAISAKELPSQEERAFSSKLVYYIPMLKIDAREVISKTLYKGKVPVKRENKLFLYLYGTRSGSPMFYLIFAPPRTLPPGTLTILDKKGRIIGRTTIEESAPNKTLSLSLYPNPYLHYQYETTIKSNLRSNLTRDTVKFSLKIINYNNVSEPLNITIRLPNNVESYQGDLNREDNKLTLYLTLNPGETKTLKGTVIVRRT